ncbi:hypothetical protein FACS1894180_9240 [Bacteroidia bacterium]|nr:hypothetical protein FACS1894180_9240 [Bacteroidia bacterium]
MTRIQQMVWVEKYLMRSKSKLKTAGDVILAVNAPAYAGKSNGTVTYSQANNPERYPCCKNL